MSSATEPVNVHILDREYTVGVPPSERETLNAAARMLDSVIASRSPATATVSGRDGIADGSRARR